MSLLKAIPTSFKTDANYHKITLLICDYKNQSVKITLSSFVDEEAKNENSKALKETLFNARMTDMIGSKCDFSFESVLKNGNVSRGECYKEIKKLDFWKDASDV